MNNVVDEVLTDLEKFRILDNQGNTLYDNVTIEQITPVQIQGTPLNKVLFDSIKNDLNSRLLISNKATQAEAEAGSNNTKYLTPLRVKEFANKNVGCKITRLNLSSSSVTEINTSDLFDDKTEKVEIIVDIRCSSTSQNGRLTLNGTSIRTNGAGTVPSSSSSRNIFNKNNAYEMLGKLELYPSMQLTSSDNSGFYSFTGKIINSSSEEISTEQGTFSNLTSIVFPRLSNSNHNYQVAIYKFLR